MYIQSMASQMSFSQSLSTFVPIARVQEVQQKNSVLFSRLVLKLKMWEVCPCVCVCVRLCGCLRLCNAASCYVH